MASLYKIGALGTDDPITNPVLMFQAQFLGGTDRVSHLRLPFQTGGYQVTVGKTLYIVKFLVCDVGVVNAAYYKLGYADNDVGFDTATARTNPVMSLGVDDANNNGLAAVGSDAQAGNSARNADLADSFFKIAVSQKFPFIRRVSGVTGNTVMVWGIEL